MKLSRKPKPEPKPEPPTRSVTFSMNFPGKGETLKSLHDAWTQARSLGVPDHAGARVYSSVYDSQFSVTFSWSEKMP